jgi:pimeloyl-ACP methyl ester carboxylesterase
MKLRNLIRMLAIATVLAPISVYAKKAPLELGGVSCQTPPPLHCPDANCPGPMVIEQGSAVEPKTGRKFFLDYPCDLKRGEKVTFILSLHGAGSYGNWQRHYFPIVDYKDKYRLVIATPNSPTHVWSEGDDAYLQNIVNLVYEQVGAKNIKAFWLVGHSQGGMTSNRLVRTDFFKGKVDGWLSLSGGRLGPTPPIPASFFAGARGGGAATSTGSGAPPVPAPGPAGLAAAMAALREPPAADFSFIFETGEHELGDQPIPDASPWATKFGCAARVRMADVVDTKPGYVYDSTRQNPGSDAWGHLPRPGTAEVFEYPHCKDGRVVADVVRVGKGHTEGLEPQVTEQLVKLMVSAKK